MGLSQRGRGHRLFESDEQRGQGPADGFFHLGAGHERWERGQLVLQVRQIVGESLAEDIASGRKELPELDRDRSQPD